MALYSKALNKLATSGKIVSIIRVNKLLHFLFARVVAKLSMAGTRGAMANYMRFSYFKQAFSVASFLPAMNPDAVLLKTLIDCLSSFRTNETRKTAWHLSMHHIRHMRGRDAGRSL